MSRVKGELHPTKKRFRGGLGMWMAASNGSICFDGEWGGGGTVAHAQSQS